MSKKPGFIIDIIDSVIVIISIIVVQGTVWLIAGIMADFMDAHLLDIILHIPKFDYTVMDGQEYGGHFWDLYQQLRWGAIIVLAGIIILSAGLRLFGQTGIYGDGKFWTIKLKTSVVMILFLMVFPFMWDGMADGISIASHLVLNPVYSFDEDSPCPETWSSQEIVSHYNESPFAKDGKASDFLIHDTGKAEIACTPNFKLHYLLEQLHGTTSYKMPEIPDPLEWITKQISLILTGIVSAVFFTMVRGIITIQVTILSTMVAIMTNLLTGMIVAGLPIFLILRQVPRFGAISDKFISALPALLLVPLMSCVIISVGASFVSTVGSVDYGGHTIAGLDAGIVYTWIATLGVLIFAVSIPVTMVPLLSNVTMQATQIVTSSVQAAATSAAMVAMGAGKGIASMGGLGGSGGGRLGGGMGGLGGGDSEESKEGESDESEGESDESEEDEELEKSEEQDTQDAENLIGTASGGDRNPP